MYVHSQRSIRTGISWPSLSLPPSPTRSAKGRSRVAHRSYRPSSPYASPYRPARWPWVLGATIVVAILAVTGLLVADHVNNPPPDEQQLAQAVASPPAEDESGLLAEAPTQEPSPTPEPTETPEPTATDEPEPTPTEIDPNDATDLVEQWVALWEEGDYAGMYSLTSEETQVAYNEAEFTNRYVDIEEEAGILELSGAVSGEANDEDEIPLDITVETSLVGTIEDALLVPVAPEDDTWRVTWSPSLIFSQLNETSCVEFQGSTVQRGSILDQNGVVLAEDANVSQVGIVPGDLEDSDSTLATLSDIIDMPVADIQARIEGTDPSWLVPLRNISGDSVDLINEVQELPGVQVRRDSLRTYPQGELTAHLTGWVSPASEEDVVNDETGSVQPDEMVGRAGLELGANELLAGRPGGTLVAVECESRAERDVIAEDPGEPARDLHLTIDVEFQQAVDISLTNQEDGEDGRRAAAVVLDPDTGAVMAMVSHPTFDPNLAVTNAFTEEDLQYLNDTLLRPQANRATMEVYPTGSIFKLITSAAAMEYLDYTGDTPVDCPASFSIGSQTWDDWVVENGLSAQGPMDLHNGLVRSCNTVYYQIGADLDDQDAYALPDMSHAFGLGEATEIPYFPERSGTIPDPEWKSEVIGDGWSTGDAVNLSIGQGYMEASPLQMANAYAAIANGGTVLRPYLVDATQVSGEQSVEQVGERVVLGELPLTDSQLAELHAALDEQPQNGLGVGADRIFIDFNTSVAGKTGTAQNSLDDSDLPHSWFAGYGPSDDPAIASAVLIENMGEGIQFAAPATLQFWDAYFNGNMPEVREEATPPSSPDDEADTMAPAAEDEADDGSPFDYFLTPEPDDPEETTGQ